jgi:hypothetical protein
MVYAPVVPLPGPTQHGRATRWRSVECTGYHGQPFRGASRANRLTSCVPRDERLGWRA